MDDFLGMREGDAVADGLQDAQVSVEILETVGGVVDAEIFGAGAFARVGVLAAVGVQQVAPFDAAHHFHGKEPLAVLVAAERVDGDDVGMIEEAGDERFGDEGLFEDDGGVAFEVFGDDFFDRDFAAQCVLSGAENLAHAAFADHAVNGVFVASRRLSVLWRKRGFSENVVADFKIVAVFPRTRGGGAAPGTAGITPALAGDWRIVADSPGWGARTVGWLTRLRATVLMGLRDNSGDKLSTASPMLARRVLKSAFPGDSGAGVSAIHTLLVLHARRG